MDEKAKAAAAQAKAIAEMRAAFAADAIRLVPRERLELPRAGKEYVCAKMRTSIFSLPDFRGEGVAPARRWCARPAKCVRLSVTGMLWRRVRVSECRWGRVDVLHRHACCGRCAMIPIATCVPASAVMCAPVCDTNRR
jgi:hypothetical protein